MSAGDEEEAAAVKAWLNHNPGRELGGEENFFIRIARNPLKSPDLEK